MANLLSKKIHDASKALTTLEEALNADYTIFVRDSAIQRFEYTTEAFWKCLQVHLKENEGVLVSSPKSAIREAKKNGIMDDIETVTALEMIDDRNLTAHTYHEEVAQKLFSTLPRYAELMRKILEKVNKIEMLDNGLRAQGAGRVAQKAGRKLKDESLFEWLADSRYRIPAAG